MPHIIRRKKKQYQGNLTKHWKGEKNQKYQMLFERGGKLKIPILSDCTQTGDLGVEFKEKEKKIVFHTKHGSVDRFVLMFVFYFY